MLTGFTICTVRSRVTELSCLSSKLRDKLAFGHSSVQSSLVVEMIALLMPYFDSFLTKTLKVNGKMKHISKMNYCTALHRFLMLLLQ